ncbi:MAG: helix-turn-helix domain-containing protein [Pseudomonadota bacterium]|nr:helix-turn-helix domain-containing protein [Pseudomonadota bacterium]
MQAKKGPGGAGGDRPGNKRGDTHYQVEQAARQRSRLLRYLQEHGTVSTLEARATLHIMSPASRVFELRRDGYRIVTAWDILRDIDGTEHRVGRYCLQGMGRPRVTGAKARRAYGGACRREPD